MKGKVWSSTENRLIFYVTKNIKISYTFKCVIKLVYICHTNDNAHLKAA